MEEGTFACPVRREEELVVQELGDEVLVYDLRRHRAHALNRAAALVWRQCDGKTSVSEMAAALHRELGIAADEEMARLALRRLAAARLLQTPPPADAALSRRDLMRKLGVGVAAALPVVTSIVAPHAAAAASVVYIDPALCNEQNVGKCCLNPGSTNKYCRYNPGMGKYECTGNPCP
ncbi:MAG: PqqD family protein [Armatimonadota bacterium]|nr:PqqD family protein [Armatimonadota bacterium]